MTKRFKSDFVSMICSHSLSCHNARYDTCSPPASIRLLRLTRPNPRTSRGRQPLNRIPIVNRPRRHDSKQGHHQSRKPDVQGIVDVLCYEADEEGDDLSGLAWRASERDTHAKAGEKDVVDQDRQSLAFKVLRKVSGMMKGASGAQWGPRQRRGLGRVFRPFGSRG